MTHFDPSAFLEDELDEIERRTHSVSGVDDAGKPVSSGLLALDWVLGGGFRPAWYTNAGGEQSAKTTSALLSALSVLKSGRVGNIFFWDYEGSTGNSQSYVESLSRSIGLKYNVDDLFGKRDLNTGKWIKRPLIRYYSESIGDKFFNHLHATLKRLPDKRMLGDKWWYVYEDTKDNAAKYKDYADSVMPKKYGKGIYVPAPNGDLQALYITDSYPAMNPLANDDEEHNKALGMTARFFSAQLPRVKGMLRSKRVAVLGINQLRDKPMAMYEAPVYEPGGTALKFNCMTFDTLLQTDQGMLTAEEMAFNPAKKMLGQQGIEECAAFEYKGHSQIIKVQTSSGIYIKGKPGHAILTVHGGQLSKEFKTLEDLKPVPLKEVYVATRVGSNVWSRKCEPFTYQTLNYNPAIGGSDLGKVTLPKRMSPELAAVLGYLVGDGHVKNGHIHFAAKEDEQVDNFIAAFAKAFKVEPSILDSKVTPNGIYIYHAQLGPFLTYLGVGNKSSYQKSIPYYVRTATKKCVLSFIRALFDSDGSVHSKTLNYTTVSTELLTQVQQVLLNLGIRSTSKFSERFQAHGYDKGGMHVKNANSLNIYGKGLEMFAKEVGFGLSRKQELLLNFEATDRLVGNSDLPKLTYWKQNPKFIKYVKEALGLHPEIKTLWTEHFKKERHWYSKLSKLIGQCRTTQEREALSLLAAQLKNLVDFTIQNRIYWERIIGYSQFEERVATYDGNMPKTSTIVTNGIVSHNSDVRVWHTSRALSAVKSFGKPEGKGRTELERSLVGGTDKYRYVHLAGKKNKLAMPDLEAFFRIWVSDANGEAQGICPVFDTIWYLMITGQLKMRGRKSMRLDLHKLGDTGVVFTWMDMKKWVLGNTKVKKEISAKLGYKPMDIRKFCFKQMEQGLATELYSNVQEGKSKVTGDDD